MITSMPRLHPKAPAHKRELDSAVPIYAYLLDGGNIHELRWRYPEFGSGDLDFQENAVFLLMQDCCTRLLCTCPRLVHSTYWTFHHSAFHEGELNAGQERLYAIAEVRVYEYGESRSCLRTHSWMNQPRKSVADRLDLMLRVFYP